MVRASLVNLSSRLLLILAALVGVVLLSMHLNPGATYPLEGLANAVGLVLLMLASGIVAAKGCEKSDKPDRIAAWFSPGMFLLAFTAWVWARTAFSAVPTEGSETVGSFLLGLAAFWTSARLTRPIPALPRWSAWFFSGLAMFFACHAILEYHYLYPMKLATLQADPSFNPNDILSEGSAYHWQARRVGSYFVNPNVLAGFLAMCLPFLAALAWNATEPRRNLKHMGLAIVAILVCYAAFRTHSVGGMMAFAIAIVLIILAAQMAKKRATSIALTGLMLAALLFLPGAAEVQKESAPPPRAARTLQQRAFYLQSAWTMFKQAPLTGHGLGAYARLYAKARVEGAGESRYAHNFVAQLAVETGTIGL